MTLSKSKITMIIIALLVIFFAISMIYRVALPYHSVFINDWIKFTSNDAYYHMRIVDTMVHNFPRLTSFDPYFIYPGGIQLIGAHFFDWLLAIIIWVIGFGSPSQHLVDVVGAYYPAVLAALTVIPVFFIGQALFNRWVGVMAAFLAAILPGEFMGRSVLGFTDNHVAETLFSTVMALFLILAMQSARYGQDNQERMSLNNLFKRDWKIIARPLIYSALAGLFLAVYLNTWAGAPIFVFIIAVYLVIQFIINHLRGKSSEHLGIVVFVTFLVADIFFLPFSFNKDISLGMVGALVLPLALTVISWYIFRRGWKTYYFPVSLIVIGGIFLGLFYAVDRAAVSALWTNFLYVFAPGGGSSASTTMEMQPFLYPQGSFTTSVAWGNFTTSFFLIKPWPIPGFGLIALCVLIWLSIKQRGDKEINVFFVLWTLIILTATLVQRRFAYYLVVNIAALSAYISWEIIWRAGLRRLAVRKEEKATPAKVETGKNKTKKQPRKTQVQTIYYVFTFVAIICVFFSVFFFNITKSVDVAAQAAYAPTNGWEESLNWMKNNTPEPLGDKDAYYNIYNTDYKYPDSAYGVTAWWDYGYWISRTARRLPSANPSQESEPIKKVANLFLSSDITTSAKYAGELKSSYIIADNSLILSKIWAVITWAGQSQEKYFDTYYVSQNGKYSPVIVYTPDFYRMLIVRLYSFDGKAVANGKPTVITYAERVQNGATFKIVSEAKEYSSYQAALDYISVQKSSTSGGSSKYAIVGVNPFYSPVPIDAVPDYKIVYSSTFSDSFSGNFTIPDVKVFERVK